MHIWTPARKHLHHTSRRTSGPSGSDEKHSRLHGKSSVKSRLEHATLQDIGIKLVLTATSCSPVILIAFGYVCNLKNKLANWRLWRLRHSAKVLFCDISRKSRVADDH
ncbi:hypothetical protein AVEN_52011-1 [Araneus ventricosus]|uniref:Uncharacterized protein n=1 Tax=Araneus ventricosus TaxID=182803 RepID=A0A4Y2CF32_ARAVE|nr:hypothetical protein AVEN_52011-1 [Araneus ventricosus]